MTQGWTSPCGGGLWWDKAHSYTGAIENELFLAVAAGLANRVDSTAEKDYYLSWALKQWEWFLGSGMMNEKFEIHNGLDLRSCKSDNGTVWSYNQGVVVGALLELHKTARNDIYLVYALKIAFAGINLLGDEHGILHEPCEPDCGADGPQFKGIFVRNLRKLQRVVPTEKVRLFIKRNAESIWVNDRGEGDELGLVWSGPFDGATASTQSSALDALVADLADATVVR